MRLIVARDLMTPQVLSVSVGQRLSELATFLTDHQITGAAVRDEDGKYVGVVSATDIATATGTGGDRVTRDRSRPDFYVRGWEDSLAEEELEGIHLEADGLHVRDIMTPQVYSISADAPVSEVARTLLDGHLHRLLVIENDELVGVISTSDLLGLLLEEDSLP